MISFFGIYRRSVRSSFAWCYFTSNNLLQWDFTPVTYYYAPHICRKEKGTPIDDFLTFTRKLHNIEGFMEPEALNLMNNHPILLC